MAFSMLLKSVRHLAIVLLCCGSNFFSVMHVLETMEALRKKSLHQS